MVAVIIAGTISGRIIRKKMLYLVQPSILAASSSSRGMVRMNCMIRKIKNGVAK
ncbi:hypothetical protein D3C81_2215530 [compost metagenome]